MPILDVSLVGAVPAARRRGLPRRLADAAARVLETPAGGTWVRLSTLPLKDYAENGGPLPRGVRPVFVRILEARPPQGKARARRVVDLTAAIAKACGRPAENVHVLYEPPGAGRAAFGGRLVE